MNEYYTYYRELKDEYLKIFMKIEGRLKHSILDKKFLNETLEELGGMLYNCQVENRSINSILPGGAEGFIDEIEKTYYMGIPKKEVYIELLAQASFEISLFSLLFYLAYGESILVLLGMPVGIVFTAILHALFRNFKNSKLRSLVEFIIILVSYTVVRNLFIETTTSTLSPTIIYSIIIGFGCISVAITSRKKLLRMK